MANLIQIDTTGCNSDYTVSLPNPTIVGKYITVKDKGTNPSFFASNAIIIVSGQPFFGGSTAEYIRSSRGALSFITTTSTWRLLNTVPYTTLGEATLANISTTHLLVYGSISSFGQITTNGIRVPSIDAQVAPTINASPVMNTSNIVSTVVGLGSTGFLSSVSAMNESFTSTTQNLGGYGYISTPQIQSTIQGLGNAGYISTSWVTSTVEGLGKTYLSTPALTSTAQGLGTFGYISSSWLTSTMQGLGSIDYISTAQLTSTVSNMLLINTSNYLSTFQKIGSNYISSSFLTNTIQNLGLSYVSAASFNSSISGTAKGYETNLTSSVSGFASLGYISTYSLFSTTEGVAKINQSNTATSLSSLGDTYIATTSIQSTVAGLGSLPFRYISTASLVSTMSGLTKSNVADLTSSVINMGQYYISRAALVSTTLGLTSNSASNITSTINNLGCNTNAYISTPSLQSTINGLASPPFNYVSTASLTSTTTGMSNAVTTTNSTLIGLGSVGYVSAPSLTSTIQALGSLPYRYISTASLVSTVQGLGTSGYISRENLITTTNTLTSLNHMPPITSTLNGLGNVYISTAVIDVYQVTTVNAYLAGAAAITNALVQTANVTTSTVAGSSSGYTNGQTGTFASPRGVVVDSAGNIYVSDYNNHRIRRITPSGNVSTYAGSGAAGSADGNGTSATFYYPYQLAIDSLDNIYVADAGSHKIRKIDRFRNVTTIAGSGSQIEMDGQGTSAGFDSPSGIAIDSAGFLYVAGSGHMIRLITPTGYVTWYAGTGWPSGTDGAWNSATFNDPRGLAFGSNVLYVADSGNNKIRSITETRTVTTYSGPNDTYYNYATYIAFDLSGNMYVADIGRHAIWKVTGNGSTVTAYAGLSDNPGWVDGNGTNARFREPISIAFDSTNNMYVVEGSNQRVRKIDTAGNVSTYAGSGASSSTDGLWHTASFNKPYGIAVDSSGVVYVAENLGHKIKKITINDGNYIQGFTLSGIAIDSSFNIYVCNMYRNGAMIQKYDRYGNLQFEGGYNGGLYDTSLWGSVFNIPQGIAVNSSGVMYIADTGNNVIRMITADGGSVTTYFTGFSAPKGVALDSAGIVYVADTGNNRVGKIIPGYTSSISIGDGYAYGIAIDGSGNIYLTLPNFNQVRKYSSAGTLLNTYGHPAGSSGLFNSATETLVRFNYPLGIAVAPSGNIYITDGYNHAIRKITPNGSSGITTTFAGTGVAGYVNAPYLSAKFNVPFGITLDSYENVYVTDQGNSVIRKIFNGEVRTYAGDLTSPTAGWRDYDSSVYTRTTISSYVNVSTSVYLITQGIALDSFGNIYFANYAGNTSSELGKRIYKISPTSVTLYATNSLFPGSIAGTASLVFSPNGNLYGIETGYTFGRIYEIKPNGSFSIFAGSGNQAYADGQGTAASFSYPQSMAVDISGNLYVYDTGNLRIRKINTSGYVSTIAGNGINAAIDGQGTSSSLVVDLNSSTGIAVDIYGYVYFSDMNNGIRIINLTGYVSTPTWGQSLIAYGRSPRKMDVDNSGCLYIIYFGGIFKVYPDGTVVRVDTNSNGTIAQMVLDTSGNIYSIDTTTNYSAQSLIKFTPQPVAQFSGLWGITCLSDNLYVPEFNNNTIRKITLTGVTLITTVAGLGPSLPGTTDGPTSSARFSSPNAITTYGGNLYVTEFLLNKVRLINLSTNQVSTIPLSPSIYPDGIAFDIGGNIQITAGGSLTGSITVPTSFIPIVTGLNQPAALSVDVSGNIYVADTGNNQIKKYNSAGGLLETYGSFNNPTGVAVTGPSANPVIYAGDAGNGIVRVIYNGLVTTYSSGYNNYIVAVAVDPLGILYAADYGPGGSGYGAIRQVYRNVTTFVGSGTAAYADGSGTSASFNEIYYIAMDPSNTLYVADVSNRRVRKVDTAGNVTTFAGSGGTGFMNGPSTTAQINPLGVYVANGLVYVTDYFTNTIRLIYPDGYVTSIAGTGLAGYTGDGGLATNASFNNPRGIVLDSAGIVYVTDVGNKAIRKITLNRTVATFAGSGGAGATNGANLSATFNSPRGIVVDGSNVYVSDFNAHDIRKISGGQVTTYAGQANITGSNDGIFAIFNNPLGLATDPAGNVYVADQANFKIRKITPYSYTNTIFYANTTDIYKLPLTTMTPASFASGQANMNGMTCDRTYVYATCGTMVKSFHMTTGAVTIIAGTATAGSANGTTPASVGFNNLQSIAIDPSFSNLYVCDIGNARIRKIQLSPLSVTTKATLTNCVGIAIDSFGTYAYVTTSADQLYKVSLQQDVVTLLASVPGYPQYISLDPTNTYAYITCIATGVNLIRQVHLKTYTVTTIAGSGTPASIDGAGTLASFNQPYGIVFNPNDAYLYSTDRGSGLLRKTATQVFLSSMIGLTQSKTVPTILPYSSITTPQAYQFIHNSNGTIRTTPNLYLQGNTITTPLDIRATGYIVTAKTFTANSGTAGNDGYFIGDGTGVTVTSDIRTKENIQPIRNALSIVRQLQAVEYTKIDDPSRRWLGYIAQDVEALIPHIVRTDHSPEQWKSIQYTYLPGLIIEALKELKAKIDKIECLECLSTETV